LARPKSSIACRRSLLVGALVAAGSLAVVVVYAFLVFPHVHPAASERAASACKAAIALTALGLSACEARRRSAGAPLDACKVRIALLALAASASPDRSFERRRCSPLPTCAAPSFVLKTSRQCESVRPRGAGNHAE
jgi:hypothetical protein